MGSERALPPQAVGLVAVRTSGLRCCHRGSSRRAPGRETKASFLVWGRLLAALSALLPFLALGGLIFGVFALTKDKPGHGAGMIVVSLLGPVIWIYVMSSVILRSNS